MQSLPGLLLSDADNVDIVPAKQATPKKPLLIYPDNNSDSKNIIYEDYSKRFRNENMQK